MTKNIRLRSVWHFSELAYFLSDYILLWAAVVCAFKLSPRFTEAVREGIWLAPNVRLIGYGLPACMTLGLQLAGLQRNRSGFRPGETLMQAAAGLSGGMAAFVGIHAVVEFSLVGRFVLILSLIYGVAFVVGSRMVLGKMAEQERRKVLVYGSKSVYLALATLVKATRLPIELVGHAELDTVSSARPDDLPATSKGSLYEHCEKVGAEEIVVEVADGLTPRDREALLFCTGNGISVVELGYFHERNFERVHVVGLKESWFWGYDPAHAHPLYFAIKRAMDVVISVIGLACFAPIAPILIVLIKLQDGGPFLYSQIRVGLRNQPFRIFKVRTMRVDSEKNGPQWTTRDDERATAVGRFLRKTRIDEVPQFWNILRGDMSFIGPRPERPELVEAIELEIPYYRYRHLIKPGLTGWAQVNYPYGASIDDARQKLSYDLYYMKYGTLTREFRIVLRTVVAMVKGAR